MHIFFSGIGGAGIGPLSLISHQAGYDVSGSDKQDSSYIHYLREHGVSDIHIGQSYEAIKAVHEQKPIDWYVFSSAITKEQADPPELRFCQEHGIRTSRRNEFLNTLLEERNLKLVAIAGTHGKTTTTAMTIWLFKQLGLPVSYSVGAKLPFGEMGSYDPASEFFVYEADEYDQNFLAFHPFLSIITGVDWDHPDVFPTRESYYQAFQQFLQQSERAVMWDEDADRLQPSASDTIVRINEHDNAIEQLQLAGHVNRLNAWEVACAVSLLTQKPREELLAQLNRFPGVSRRFEQIAPGVYSDYAHTPPKIRGALQLAHEVGGDNVVVVYEGLHNTRQHFIKDELRDLFSSVKKLYVVPSYLARENASLPLLAPNDLITLMNPETQAKAEPAALNDQLAAAIQHEVAAGNIVLCVTAGGGGSLDEWLRKTFA